jgi:hypothetical protein
VDIHRLAPVQVFEERQGKAFFFEKKKQKTFISCASGTMPAMASIVGAAEE